ncbi:hypothetical protein C6496_19510 [Candidatus Poribacteria bacterium]|nr:MAG: hypothetical protein C6496_19510 [Candidatus Poribacteria bacterium]
MFSFRFAFWINGDKAFRHYLSYAIVDSKASGIWLLTVSDDYDQKIAPIRKRSGFGNPSYK